MDGKVGHTVLVVSVVRRKCRRSRATRRHHNAATAHGLAPRAPFAAHCSSSWVPCATKVPQASERLTRKVEKDDSKMGSSIPIFVNKMSGLLRLRLFSVWLRHRHLMSNSMLLFWDSHKE